MPMLEAHICDVRGAPLAEGVIHQTTEGAGISVTIPHCDSRTASATVPIFDPVARQAKPLSRVLAVTYGPYLIFKGPILQVTVDFAAGTVTINAHDATIKLKHHYHRYGDRVVDEGYPIDGRGLRRLVESSIPSQSELARGVPPNGILWGENTFPNEGPRPENIQHPEPGDGLWRRVRRGDNVWGSIQNLQQTLGGPEFRFQPIDRFHPSSHNPDVIADGFYCELDTFEQPGEVPDTPLVVFEHGTGIDNAENITYDPDGDVVRNWFRQVNPSGEKDRQDTSAGVTAQKQGAQEDFGLMQGWESSGQIDSTDVLREKAKAMVTAYGRPPDFFTVTPRADDASQVPQFPRDFVVGDFVRARAERGVRQINLIGRVLSATVASVDQAANAKVSIDCAPFLPDEPIDS